MKRFLHRALLAGPLAVFVALSSTLPAHAYRFEQRLRKGDKGRDVRALQMRLAGWFPGDKQEVFRIDGRFGRQTVRAVKAFEEAYGLRVDGKAQKDLFRVLGKLQDRDGSTKHFDWSEFEQNSNSSCGAKANAYAGTLRGGLVSPQRTRMYVKRLMWRLEAIRRKARSRPIGINSGFRSVAYNDCIGGARASQHMYGTAADARQAEVSNRRQRWLAKRSQFHGIGCYSSQSHNHLDLRIDNVDLPSQRSWWWPDKDGSRRELDESGRPCWGESTPATSPSATAEGGDRGASLVPSALEVESFEAAGEGILPEGAD